MIEIIAEATMNQKWVTKNMIQASRGGMNV